MRAERLAWFASMLVLASACTKQRAATPTEVIVEIDAETGVKNAAASLHLVVEGAENVSDPSQLALRLDQTVKPAKFPLRVALVPLSGDGRRMFVLTATALDDKQAFVAQARLVSGCVAGEVRYARILLEDACLNLQCGGTALQTCASGQCVSAQADAASFSQDAKHPKLVSPSTSTTSPDAGTHAADSGADGGTARTGGNTASGGTGGSAGTQPPVDVCAGKTDTFCTTAGPTCASPTTLKTCTADANGCKTVTDTVICIAPQVCTGAAGHAACVCPPCKLGSSTLGNCCL